MDKRRTKTINTITATFMLGRLKKFRFWQVIQNLHASCGNSFFFPDAYA